MCGGVEDGGEVVTLQLTEGPAHPVQTGSDFKAKGEPLGLLHVHFMS